MRKMIVVLGMHRSGTSLVAEMVHRWGGATGGGDRLLAGDAWNARGYFEYVPLLELNDELLRAAGGSWRAPPEAAAVERLAGDRDFGRRAQTLIAEFDAAGGPWLWKDPRLPALLPFWERFWPDPAFIIPVREPLHIAPSLAGRDQLSRTAALILWQHAVLAIMNHVHGKPHTFFVSYEELLSDPTAQGIGICAFLDESCGPRNGRPADAEKVAAAVDRSLNHGEGAHTLADAPDVTAEQKALHQFLLTKVADRSAAFDPAAYPLWPGWHEALRAFEDLKRANQIIDEKEAHMRRIRHSVSYRLGRALTKPFRLLFSR